MQGLVTDPKGWYVDGTLGGGGHAAALLDALAEPGRVIGIDQDQEAIDEARRRLAGAIERGRFETIRGNFGQMESLLIERSRVPVNGILLDLGVSSHQIDEADRGFSYSAEGRLDMRMDREGGMSADDIVNHWTENDLKRILFQYGEEPRARKLARAIVQARPLESTAHLAAVLRKEVPGPEALKTLSRVFQAIRIVVNRELDVLEQILQAAVRLVVPGGRIAVISYHSLEDRRVKHVLRYGNLKGEPVKDLYGNLLSPWREVTRKPIAPDEAEVSANPRARSARLRISERVEMEGAGY